MSGKKWIFTSDLTFMSKKVKSVHTFRSSSSSDIFWDHCFVPSLPSSSFPWSKFVKLQFDPFQLMIWRKITNSWSAALLNTLRIYLKGIKFNCPCAFSPTIAFSLTFSAQFLFPLFLFMSVIFRTLVEFYFYT